MSDSHSANSMDRLLGYIQNQLPALLKLLSRSDIRDLEVENDGLRLRLRRKPGPAVAAEQVGRAAEVIAAIDAGPPVAQIVSPLVGTFYRAGQTGDPLVSEGSEVNESTVVGIVEALHVLTDVEAGLNGTVIKELATDGQPVEYGQPLFEVMLSG